MSIKNAGGVSENEVKLPMVKMLIRRRPLCRLVYVAILVGVVVLVSSTKQLSSLWSAEYVPSSRHHVSCKYSVFCVHVGWWAWSAVMQPSCVPDSILNLVISV